VAFPLDIVGQKVTKKTNIQHTENFREL